MARERIYGVNLNLLNREVTNIFAKEPERFIGKTVTVDLASITKGKLGELKGIIKEFKGDAFFADAKEIKFYDSFIKRFVRRRITKIDDSFLVETKDDKKLRIKPVLITRKRVKGSVETALRKETRKFLSKLSKSLTSDELFKAILVGDVQKKLSKKLKKIYPLSFCEIRRILIDKKKIK